MDRDRANRLSCVVCAIESKRHTGWFLVMDNYWLDRVKILSWHPVLAQSGGMRGVCGRRHLKTLLTHWLNYSNLQLMASGVTPLKVALDQTVASPGYANISVGRVLGELAVERDSLSPSWTGSPEAIECIMNTLIGETETRTQALEQSS